MAPIKAKHIYLVIFGTSSLVYFRAISNLGVNDFWKSEMILITLQLLGIAYLTRKYWHRRTNREIHKI